jgi:GNAT superfamily N-acetyltransferase
MITIRRLDIGEISRLGEMDRSEHVTRLYAVKDGLLTSQATALDVPPWDDAHVSHMTHEAREEMALGAWTYGAFREGNMGGLVCVGGRLIGGDGDLVQLVLMHVSKDFRRQGVASRLFDLAVQRARDLGAWGLYISATPSNSALGFYISRGAGLASDVIPELYESEPEDIHLVLPLEQYVGHHTESSDEESNA